MKAAPNFDTMLPYIVPHFRRESKPLHGFFSCLPISLHVSYASFPFIVPFGENFAIFISFFLLLPLDKDIFPGYNTHIPNC